MDWPGALAVLVAAPLLGGVAGYYATVHQIPRRIMARTMAVLSQRSPVNTFLHGKRPTARARVVVRPAPDLIYSSMVYDLHGGKLRLRGKLPPGYWSLSL